MKLLLVEDDIYISEVYQRIFKEAGFEVDACTTGEDAMTKIKETVYDMTLLDIMIPKLDGLTVLKKIRTEESPNKNSPIYMVSNLAEDKVVKEAFEIGANGFIVKSQTLPKDILREVLNYIKTKQNPSASQQQSDSKPEETPQAASEPQLEPAQ